MIKEVFKPASLDEAVKLRSSDNYYLSGGTQINWTPSVEKRREEGKPEIEKVILLQGLLSENIKKEGSALIIGAGSTLQNIIDSPLVPDALKKAAGYIASRNVRNMATIGGNIAANRPDSYILPCLIALKADVETVGKGILCVGKYIREENDSLILNIILPEVEGACVIDVSVKSSAAYPSVTTAVRVSKKDAVVAVGCMSDHVIRLTNVEAGISNGSLNGESLMKAVSDSINPRSDLAGSSEYKKYLVGTMIAHSVELSLKEGGV